MLELLLALALVALVTALTAPSYAQLRDRARLRAAAENLYAELQRARGQTLLYNHSVTVTVRPTAAGWCYGTSLNGGCDCSRSAAAAPGGCELTRSNGRVELRGVELKHPAAGDAFSFAPPRGLSRAGRLELEAGGWRLRLLRSALGRLRLCTPHRPLPGYPSC